MNTIVIGALVGTGLLQCQPELPVGWFAYVLAMLSLPLSVIAVRSVDAVVWRSVSLLALATLLGFGWAWWRAELRLAEVLPMSAEGQDVAVVGVIDGLPAATGLGVHFPFLIEAGPAWLPRRVALTWYAANRDDSPLPEVHAGERWALTVRLKRPHGAANPGGVDRSLHMLEEGIRASGYVRNALDNERREAEADGLTLLVLRLRERIRERMLGGMQGNEWAGVLVALAVGDQQAIDERQWDRFRRLGIVHLVVISGLHITLVGGLAYLLAAWIWRHTRGPLHLPVQRFATLGGALAASTYALLAGMGVSVQRSLIMLLVVAVAHFLARRVRTATVLGWAGLLVLVIDPWAVLAAGFWLSFGAVAVLMYISSGEIAGLTGWRAMVRAQMAVTLLMMPALLVFFHQFSVVAPLANALAIPVLGMVITPLSLVYAVLPIGQVGSAVGILLDWTMIPLDWLAALPAAVWQQAPPPLPVVLAGLVGCIWMFLPLGTPGRFVGILALWPMLAWTPERPAAGGFRVVVLDVGQGLSVHVQTAGNDLLFDAGPAIPGGGDSGQRVVLPYLRAVGVRKLDTLVVSHPDLDHAGGAGAVLGGVPVGRRMISPGDAERMIEPASWEYCRAGRSELFDGVRFDWLHPDVRDDGERESHGNNRSCVLKVTGVHGSVLLTADIEAKVETALVRKLGPKLKADVLLVAHHGSRSSSSSVWVDAVSPGSVIYSVGYRSRFGHPHADVWARWSAAGAYAYRTDVQGAISVDVADGPPKLTAEREEHPRYWHGR